MPSWVSGRKVSEEAYLSTTETAGPLQEYLDGMDKSLLEKKGLEFFLSLPREMTPRVICLPTTTLMAMRHLRGDAGITLADFYEMGFLVHTNDSEPGKEPAGKGYPSFHRTKGDTYLQYALDFARVEGFDGGVVTGFSGLKFVNEVVTQGVVVLSVDNLMLPRLMNSVLDESTFRPSRHAVLLHGLTLAEHLAVSDVTNEWQGQRWEARNRVKPPDWITKYLTCERLEDNLSRAIILTPDRASWEKIRDRVEGKVTIAPDRPNPMMEKYVGVGVERALQSMRG